MIDGSDDSDTARIRLLVYVMYSKIATKTETTRTDRLPIQRHPPVSGSMRALLLCFSESTPSVETHHLWCVRRRRWRLGF